MTETTKLQHSYRQQCALLEPWMGEIISAVKKELRQEHLANDRLFCQKYFPGQNIPKISLEELTAGYKIAIEKEEQGEQIGEFVFHRWLLKNTHLYAFFEKELSALAEDFTQLEALDDVQGIPIKKRAVEQFGAEATYIFSIVNGVVFSDRQMEELRTAALEEQSTKLTNLQQQEESRSWEKRLRDSEAQVARLIDRYEKRLTGWERKYDNDTMALKKQLAHLQRKLQERN